MYAISLALVRVKTQNQVPISIVERIMGRIKSGRW